RFEWVLPGHGDPWRAPSAVAMRQELEQLIARMHEGRGVTPRGDAGDGSAGRPPRRQRSPARAGGRGAPDGARPSRPVPLIEGGSAPALGLGTWRMGEDARRRRAEVEALKLGIDLGMTLVDTAEMYGSGEAERIVAEAIDGRRESVFL